MLFYGSHSGSIFCEPRAMETEHPQQLPARFIELACVPHDIHVPHVITVPWINNTAVSDFPFRHKAPCFFLAITAVAPPEVTKHPQRKAKIEIRNLSSGSGTFARLGAPTEAFRGAAITQNSAGRLLKPPV